MAFRKKSVAAQTVGATGSFNIPLGAPAGMIYGFTAVSTGDAAARIKMQDADGRVFYLDAADKDYTTKLHKLLAWDDTVTGLSFTAVDVTGAAAAAGEPLQPPVLVSPITVTWSNGTAGDTLAIDLWVEV